MAMCHVENLSLKAIQEEKKNKDSGEKKKKTQTKNTITMTKPFPSNIF